MKPEESYYVTTYDWELGEYTPQDGVPEGPYTLWGLKAAIKELKRLGYDGGRDDASILVERGERRAN